ncbi:MAG: type IX secretion system membrane protein PorP/SprF [Bacteroidales bacterium]
MNRTLTTVLIIFFFSSVFCQETDYGPGYQTIIAGNPAFTGSSGESVLKLSYLNFFPGNHYNFHSVFFSQESYYPALHGGAGIYVSDDYIGGIVNDLRGGLAYSYFLRAGEDLYINAGLSASFFHRGFNFGDAVLPDQIDALGGVTLPSSQMLTDRGRTVFDVGTGFLAMKGNIVAGFSVTHLAEPDLSGTGSSVERLRRKYSLSFLGDFDLAKKNKFLIRPLASLEIQGDYLSAAAGAIFESRNLGFNSVFIFGNNKNVDFIAGFSFKSDLLTLYYNYRFNIKSESLVLPFSIAQQAGVAFSLNRLNNVEKRIKGKTINAPGL